MSERGAGSVMAIAAIALVTFVGIAVLMATQIVIARVRAVTAADAAALAAAPMTFPPVAGGQSPVEGARTLAEANGARLVSCLCAQVATLESRRVEVTVAFLFELPILGQRWIRATSAAEFLP